MSIQIKLWAIVPGLLVLAACGVNANRTSNASLQRAVASPLTGQTKEVAAERPEDAAQPREIEANTNTRQTNQVNPVAPAAHELWVADQEEVLKRLLLVQQDVQKVYEGLVAQANAWTTWWTILENDWYALCLAIQQNGAVFSSPSRIVQANLDYNKILQNITVAQNRLEEMANTLSAGQSLDAKYWPRMGEVLALIATLIYAVPAANDSSFQLRPQDNAAVSTNQNIKLAPAGDNGPSLELEEDPAVEQVGPENTAVPITLDHRPGALSLVGLLL